MITNRSALLVLAVVALVATSLVVTRKEERQSYRRLRSFDPDHRTCGEGKVIHDYAVHCLYGAFEHDYYTRNTVTTDRKLSPHSKADLEKILRALAYVARKTKRAVRIRMSVLPGYNREHQQPYSLVDANFLFNELGVGLVEPQYWAKAQAARRHLPNERKIEFGADPIATLEAVSNAVEDPADEFVFNVKDLTKIDSDALGRLVGSEGGYVDGEWVKTYTCQGAHPGPEVIPRPNDPLLFASGNYYIDRD